MTQPQALQHILTLSCADQPGIVARVSSLLFERGGNILDAAQFDDGETGQFFMRVVFTAPPEGLLEAFAQMARALGMEWSLRPQSQHRRALILASKFDHCLVDLLYRWRIGEIPMVITGIVSNHPVETYPNIDFGDLQFHYLPVTKETKAEQEAALWALIQKTNTELVVLARYMQVLSEDLTHKLAGRCINIHHSFLPGFKGARPYHQAHTRGVKVIGASAHYATADLDEGPIIEQDVERVGHRDTPEDLIRKGRDIERRVLARAVRWWCEDRVLLNASKTVVFPD